VLLSRIAEKIGLDPVPVIDTPPDEASEEAPGPAATVRETAAPEGTGPEAAGQCRED
jgi:hypothetical protein